MFTLNPKIHIYILTDDNGSKKEEKNLGTSLIGRSHMIAKR